jgi:hypothetical protein
MIEMVFVEKILMDALALSPRQHLAARPPMQFNGGKTLIEPAWKFPIICGNCG